MTLDHLTRLEDVSNTLAILCERVKRRAAQPPTTISDGYMNQIMGQSLAPVREAVCAYRDFYRGHAGADGHIPESCRESYFDLIASLGTAITALDDLTNRKMNRSSSAPGTLRRLSPLFSGVVSRERDIIDQVKVDLQTLMKEDLDFLKTMKRSGERERGGLHLAYSAN